MFQTLGYFQLNNLILNRIPFCLFQIETNLESWYTGTSLLHLQNYSESFSATTDFFALMTQIQESLKKRQWPQHGSIVIICQNGLLSAKITKALEELGFMNVFYAPEGFLGLQKEKLEKL